MGCTEETLDVDGDAVSKSVVNGGAALAWPTVETLPSDLVLDPLEGDNRTLGEQVKLFHLVAVVLDPYTYESSWLLDTARRILHHFQDADCRTALILTTDDQGARDYLDTHIDSAMVFADPDRTFVTALGVKELPAFVHIDHNCGVVGLAEGWNPEEWREIAKNLAEVMSWSRPEIPRTGDPVPYEGSAALGT